MFCYNDKNNFLSDILNDKDTKFRELIQINFD